MRLLLPSMPLFAAADIFEFCCHCSSFSPDARYFHGALSRLMFQIFACLIIFHFIRFILLRAYIRLLHYYATPDMLYA